MNVALGPGLVCLTVALANPCPTGTPCGYAKDAQLNAHLPPLGPRHPRRIS